MRLLTRVRRVGLRPIRTLLALLVVFTVASLAWALPPNATHAATSQQLLYVALSGGVRVYDIANNHTYLRTIPLLGFNWERGIQASVANKMLYVSYMWRGQRTPNDGWVVAVDLVTEKMVWAKKYPIADAIAITPDGSKMIIGSGEGDPNRNYFYVANAKTGEEILPRIPVHEFTHNGLLNLAGTRAYLSSIEYDYLVVADMATQQVIKKVGPFGAGNPKNKGIRPFTINGSETLAFVNTNNLQGFEVADIATGQVLHRVEVQGFPYDPAKTQRNPSHGVGLTSDETELWVAGVKDHVVVFDATVMPPRQIGAVKTKGIPKWISFSIDNKYLYPGTGEVIDRAQRKVVASIAKSKRQVAVNWENGQPVRAGDMYARGAVTGSTPPIPATTTPSPSASVTPSPSASVTPSPSASATTTTTPAEQSVSSLSLIDTDRDVVVSGYEVLSDTVTITRNAQLQNITIRASTSPATVGSVIWTINGQRYRVENGAPYALNANSGPDYFAWPAAPGSYIISVQPFTQANGKGTAGTARTVRLTIVN